MIGMFPVLYFVWKIIHKTKIHKSSEVDLKKNIDEIEEYQRGYLEQPPA